MWDHDSDSYSDFNNNCDSNSDQEQEEQKYPQENLRNQILLDHQINRYKFEDESSHQRYRPQNQNKQAFNQKGNKNEKQHMYQQEKNNFRNRNQPNNSFNQQRKNFNHRINNMGSRQYNRNDKINNFRNDSKNFNNNIQKQNNNANKNQQQYKKEENNRKNSYINQKKFYQFVSNKIKNEFPQSTQFYIIYNVRHNQLQEMLQFLQTIGPTDQVEVSENKNVLQIIFSYRKQDDLNKLLNQYESQQIFKKFGSQIYLSELYCEKFLEGVCMFGNKCYKQHLNKKQVLCINICEQNCENAQQNICKYRHIGEKSNRNKNQINQNQNAKTTEEDQSQCQFPCIQCNKNERAYAFIPCLHFNVCEMCVKNMSNCKICGQLIQEKLKVFMM